MCEDCEKLKNELFIAKQALVSSNAVVIKQNEEIGELERKNLRLQNMPPKVKIVELPSQVKKEIVIRKVLVPNGHQVPKHITQRIRWLKNELIWFLQENEE